ncbi:MAG: histidine phosphatase family protein [Chloroflexi bacterium]|nr:histidine phosphatase family protein [Chloroflexota bacterium]
MQFYFIRHGQSANNLLYDTTGSSIGRNQDPELTPIGVEQAEKLARFLHEGSLQTDNKRSNNPIANVSLTHLYSSLMTRAVSTGTIVSKEIGLPLVAWEDIHETGGIYLDDEDSGTRIGQPGRNRNYFLERYPDLVLPLTLGSTGWWNRPFEERDQRPARAERFLNELIARHGNGDDRVAIISHGGFYNYLLRTVLKLGRDDCWFVLNNVGITRLDFHAAGVDLVYMNRIDFLPPELIT